jgi:hypothetical protein
MTVSKLSETRLNHSDGPWDAAVFGETVRVQAFSGDDIAVLGNCRDPQEWADARLIASAPELLTACEQALTMFVGQPEDYSGAGQIFRALLQAIAKAKGQAK